MSDEVVVALIAAIPGTITAVMALFIFLNQKKQVRISKSTNQLVNGSMLTQLKLHAKTARQLANLAKNPIAEAVAVLAEKELQDHIDKKQLVDGATER